MSASVSELKIAGSVKCIVLLLPVFLAEDAASIAITDEKIIFKCPEEEDYEKKIKPEEAEQLKQLKELLKSDKKLFICRKGLFNRGFKIVSEGFRCNYPTEISRKVFIVENK